MIEYKEERSAELRLRLFHGAVELDAFPVLARGRRRSGPAAVEACIIGASHAAQFDIGGTIVTEVLACGPHAVELFQDQLLGVWSPSGDVNVEAHGIDYSFSSSVISMIDAEEPLAQLRWAILDAERGGAVGLSYQFPAGADGLTPETLLWADAGDRAQVRSAHVYPGEGVVVFSESRIVARQRAGAATPGVALVEVGTK